MNMVVLGETETNKPQFTIAIQMDETKHNLQQTGGETAIGPSDTEQIWLCVCVWSDQCNRIVITNMNSQCPIKDDLTLYKRWTNFVLHFNPPATLSIRLQNYLPTIKSKSLENFWPW